MQASESSDNDGSFNQLSDSGYHRFLANIDQYAHVSCSTCGYEGTYLPQQAFKPQKWDLVDGVPVGASIQFDAGAKRGLLITDALQQIPADLSGGNEPVFEDIAAATGTLRLHWPGYQARSYSIKTKDSAKANPITREKLAFDLARRVAEYIGEMESVQIDESHADWQVGHGHIDIGRVILVSLIRVSRGSWQPHLHVINKDG